MIQRFYIQFMQQKLNEATLNDVTRGRKEFKWNSIEMRKMKVEEPIIKNKEKHTHSCPLSQNEAASTLSMNYDITFCEECSSDGVAQRGSLA